MYPVLKLEICPVACKRKQIIFKRKKKNQSTFGVIIPSSPYMEKCKREQLIFRFLLGTQPKRNKMKTYSWIQRFVHWISLKVSMCANRPICISLVYSHARCCLFILRLTSVCVENSFSRPILLGSNVNADR